MWTLKFWQAALERAIKTFAQVLAGLLAANSMGITQVDWGQSLSVAGLAAVVSVLTSVGTDLVTSSGPSVGSVEKLNV